MEPYWSKTWEINLKLYSLLLIMELLAISSLQKFLWLKLKFLRCLLLVKFMFTNLKWAELTVASGKYFYGYFYLFIQKGKLISPPKLLRLGLGLEFDNFFFQWKVYQDKGEDKKEGFCVPAMSSWSHHGCLHWWFIPTTTQHANISAVDLQALSQAVWCLNWWQVHRM